MQCKVVSTFFKVVDTMVDSEKVPKDYGTGHLLYHSELTLLEIVYKYPESNSIDLSRRLGVTRGAVTQIGNKMEEKGFIQRYSKEGNRKEKYYRLTESGELIRRSHQEYHAQANKQMCNYLCSLDETETKVIMEFFEKVMDCMPICEFECRQISELEIADDTTCK